MAYSAIRQAGETWPIRVKAERKKLAGFGLAFRKRLGQLPRQDLSLRPLQVEQASSKEGKSKMPEIHFSVVRGKAKRERLSVDYHAIHFHWLCTFGIQKILTKYLNNGLYFCDRNMF